MLCGVLHYPHIKNTHGIKCEKLCREKTGTSETETGLLQEFNMMILLYQDIYSLVSLDEKNGSSNSHQIEPCDVTSRHVF